MKNIDYALFFKANFVVTLFLFGLFLQYNSSYSLGSFLFTVMGIVSSVVILYTLLYIVFYIFGFSKKVILYILGFVFVLLDIGVLVDFFIYKLYKFHINAMVVNILTSPDAMDSIQVGIFPLVLFFGVICLLFVFEFFLLKKLGLLDVTLKEKINRRINKMVFVPLVLIVLSEKVGYGMFSLFSKNEMISTFKVIPLYQPLTFSKVAYKYFGFKPKKEIKNLIQMRASLDYPKSPLTFKQDAKKINIFVIVLDSVRNSILDSKLTPNIELFKKDALVFSHHHSGGNATRFGIFSLLYGLNSTYWFSFLQANRGPVLFDVLQKLEYQISIISSTNTNWPEFRKTCYVDVQKSISDDFEGKPWQKDIQSVEKFISQIDMVKPDKAIFSFLFLDAPHGYSFPPDENIFGVQEDVNYLTVTKNSENVHSFFAGYKNALHFNDRLFGDIVKKLKEKNLYEESLILFTSDHGQEFFEYGFFEHNSAFSEAQVHIPLLIKLPKSMQDTTSRPLSYPNVLTSHNDIVPSLLSLLGVSNQSSDFSNGYNIFSEDFNRNYLFSANWNNNAIITKDKTYLFSNMPNKMFKNEIRDNSTYEVIKDSKKIESRLLLKVIDENRRFLK